MSSDDFPHYIQWEYDKNWEGIGLSNAAYINDNLN